MAQSWTAAYNFDVEPKYQKEVCLQLNIFPVSHFRDQPLHIPRIFANFILTHHVARMSTSLVEILTFDTRDKCPQSCTRLKSMIYENHNTLKPVNSEINRFSVILYKVFEK